MAQLNVPESKGKRVLSRNEEERGQSTEASYFIEPKQNTPKSVPGNQKKMVSPQGNAGEAREETSGRSKLSNKQGVELTGRK